MLIPCPHCGSRASDEFTYLGAAGLARPAADAPLGAWSEYVYLRDNPAGPLRELWQHSSGCRAWLIVTRDTLTHSVSACETASSTA